MSDEDGTQEGNAEDEMQVNLSPVSPTGLSAEVCLPQQRDRRHQLLVVQTGGECSLLFGFKVH